MLHVITEIGKPGKHEREKRHFPDFHNQPCTALPHKHRGRRYIPHNSGKEKEWRPHNLSIQVEYTEAGPDWCSKLKYIPPPDNPEYPAAEIWPNNWKSMRPYPFTYKRSEEEWLFDPDHKRIGLRCFFQGVHKATTSTDGEYTHAMVFGKGRSEDVIDKRNSLPEASPGDKSYQVPEYSPSFHNSSSDQSIPRFSMGNSPYSPTFKRKVDTFIPLHTLKVTRGETYRQKSQLLGKHEEIQEVKHLDSWQPAKPIASTIPQLDPNEVAKRY